jgi:hypothetical protein
MWFGFKLEPIIDTAPAASKNEAQVNSGQNWPKNNRLATYDLNPWNSLYNLKYFPPPAGIFHPFWKQWSL